MEDNVDSYMQEKHQGVIWFGLGCLYLTVVCTKTWIAGKSTKETI